MIMAKLFDRLHHVCIVVHDLEKTVAYYEKLGIGPWFDYPKTVSAWGAGFAAAALPG
jgi:catechol 2,3-dioxygenase-like lactoylglutathione lyase family enzyme